MPTYHRRAFRHAVSVPCQVVRERDFRLVADRALDLSTDGMLVPLDLPVLTGEPLLVSFDLSGLATGPGGRARGRGSTPRRSSPASSTAGAPATGAGGSGSPSRASPPRPVRPSSGSSAPCRPRAGSAGGVSRPAARTAEGAPPRDLG